LRALRAKRGSRRSRLPLANHVFPRPGADVGLDLLDLVVVDPFAEAGHAGTGDTVLDDLSEHLVDVLARVAEIGHRRAGDRCRAVAGGAVMVEESLAFGELAIGGRRWAHLRAKGVREHLAVRRSAAGLGRIAADQGERAAPAGRHRDVLYAV